jgi:general secretion pathway protein L
MQEWLDALGAAGLHADLLCSEAGLLPDHPGHLVVLLEGDTLCMRRAGEPVLTLPALEVAGALVAAFGDDLHHEHVIVYVSPEEWPRRAAEVEALRSRCASLRVQLLNFGPLPLFAPQLLDAGAAINLLSGEYTPKSNLADRWRRWRVAAMLAGALLILHVGGLSLQHQQQRSAERSIDQAIGRIAQRVPGAADLNADALRRTLQRRLLAGASGAGPGALMPALAALAQSLPDAGGASVESLDFNDGRLNLTLKAPDAEKLSHIDEALRSHGWQAELTSGTRNGSVYEGHIQARVGGAGGSPAAPAGAAGGAR